MKYISIILLLVTINNYSQAFNNGVNGEITYLMANETDTEIEDTVPTSSNKYTFTDFKKASVDNNKTIHFLRFNIFKNEIEFIKDNQVYYLMKTLGRSVFFPDENLFYKVFNNNNNLEFFLVNLDNKSSLLTKQIVKFKKAKKAKTTYSTDSPAKFTRKKDKIYLAIDNVNIVRLSKKGKKDFFKSFGNKGNDVKSYAKKNKLKYKDIHDIKKMVSYFNTL